MTTHRQACDSLDEPKRSLCRGDIDLAEYFRRSGRPHLADAAASLPRDKSAWDVSQPCRGLGDVVAKITHTTGIDRVVHAVVGNCGCSERQAAMNEMFPLKGKPE